LLFILKKQSVYNCVFAIGLFLSCISVFAIVFNSGKSLTASGTSLSGKVIVIDAGHGSPDSGAVGFNGTLEKDLNLEIAQKTGEMLQKCGAIVIYTRETDATISDSTDDTIRNIKKNDMHKRVNIRDSSDADLFVSIHMNKFPDPKYKGAQVFYSNTEESKKLANCIQVSFKDVVDETNNRNIKNAGSKIYILNGAKIPSVLIECGFISNPEEEKNLQTAQYQEKISYAICSGIIKFFTNT